MHVSKLHNYQQQQQFRFLQAGATTTTTTETTLTKTTKCPILPYTLISGIHESLPPFILLQNLVFYQIHYSSVLTPFLGFIYDSPDFFEVDRIFGFPDICMDLRILGKVLADLFGFLARCTRIFGVIYPSTRIIHLTRHITFALTMNVRNFEYSNNFKKHC